MQCGHKIGRLTSLNTPCKHPLVGVWKLWQRHFNDIRHIFFLQNQTYVHQFTITTLANFQCIFKWTQPTHSNLIQNYTVSIRHSNGTSITSKSVGKQTSFTFPYNFIPGYRYYVKIASNVQIHQPREQFIENSELGIVLGKNYLKYCENIFKIKFDNFWTVVEHCRKHTTSLFFNDWIGSSYHFSWQIIRCG